MSIVVPTEFDYSVITAVRLQETITGDSGGVVRLLLDNATYLYAAAGRRTLVEISPPGVLGALETAVANAGAVELILVSWVELSADTTGIVWTAWVDDAEIEIQAYNDIAKTSSLGTTTDTGTAAGEELTGTLDLSARTGSFVRIDVRYKAGDATPANSALYSITIFEDDLTAGELPT